jgi:hypothetical protein
MATAEAAVDERLVAGIAKQKEDPWAYEWVGQSIIHILSLCAQFPEYFPVTDGVAVINRYLEATSKTLPYVDPKEWDRGLRQSVLNRLKVLCDSCTRCELEQNRIPDRGSVFGDGRVDAEILAVGEG